jgi:hypothetical protein
MDLARTYQVSRSFGSDWLRMECLPWCTFSVLLENAETKGSRFGSAQDKFTPLVPLEERDILDLLPPLRSGNGCDRPEPIASIIPLKRCLLNFLICLDRLGNVLAGGDPDETILSRLGKLKRMHGGAIPLRYPLARIIDKFLDDIDANHSINAIEEDEGKDGLLL